MSQKIYTNLDIKGNATIGDIINATSDTDKFLVSDAGVVKYRTGSEMLSDLGVAPGVASNVQHQVKAGVAINKGQAVYVTSADGTNMIVGLASNASEATSSKTMGLLDNTVAANGFANVVTEGLLSGLNTIGANSGDPVWLGTNGNLIYGLANKPYAPNHLVFIGIVTRVNANNGEIFVKAQNGFELDELHDVDLKTTTKVNGHLLGYNGSLWVNKTISEWLGYTPYNSSNPAGYISSYTETDPTVPSHVKAITTTNISNWNTAFGWGNHALAGYVPSTRTITINDTSYDLSANRSWTVTASETDTLATVTGRGNTTTGDVNINGKIRVGSFPNSTVNNGEAWIGRAADRSAGTMTVQLGGNLDRKFEVVDYGWTTVNFSVNGYGAAEASGSMRAPIFYDSNDTTYYGDFNSTTRQYQAISFGDSSRYSAINTTINGAGAGDKLILYGGTSNYDARLLVGADYDMLFKSQGNAAGRGSFKFYSGQNCNLAMTIDGSQYTSLTGGLSVAGNSSWFGGYGASSGLAFENQSSFARVVFWNLDFYEWDSGQIMTMNNGYVQANNSFRAPIFYDSNNTGYYVDPSSTSNCNVVNTAGYSNANYGFRVFRNIGNVASWPEGQHQLTLVNSDAGHVTLNFHRAGYTSNNIYYNGNFYVDAFFESTASHRAPIFYDSNNTGFYVDPSGTSNLADLYVNQLFVNGNYNGIRFNAATSSDLVASCIPGSRTFEIRNGNGPSPNYGACALITGTGLFTADVTAYYSDERLKEKKGSIINPLEKIKSLNGFYYVNNELAKENGYTDEKMQLGLSAQEVEAIAPEIVTLAPFDTNFNEDGTKTSKSGENYLTVDYGKLVPILVEAIKEQQTQIEELKELVNKLINK